MDNKNIINRLLVATPKELGVLIDGVNRETFAKNDWNLFAVKAAYSSLISNVDAELANCSTYLSFGNELMEVVNCTTGESMRFNVRQAITNLTIAKDAFQSPQVLERSVEVVGKTVEQNEIPSTIQEESTSQNKLFRGVKGLATYLGIGTTLAQAIINSKVLEKDCAQYFAAGRWYFNKEKLDNLLSKNPELLKDIHIERRKK